MLAIDDQVVADQVVRFDHLQADLAIALGQLGVAWDGWLPRSKGGHRTAAPGGAGDYRSHYSPELAELVGRLYRNEIEYFQHHF
jgi:hypothetical protein